MEQADDQATGESSRVLRFGILSTGTSFPAWAARCIRGLIALDNVKPELLMIDRPEPGRFRTAGQSAPNRRTSSLYRRALPSPSALMPVDLAVELKGAHTLHGRADADADTKRSERFSDDDIERIRSHKLDFILNFDSDTVDENILDAARYGVWCFHHGDRARYGGGPPGFWEIYNGDPATRATLYRVSDDPRSGIALKEGFFPTVNYSYAASLNRVLVDSADWPAQVCIDIKNGNSRYVDASPSKLAAPDDRSPSNAQLLAFLFKIRRNQLANAARMR